MILATLIISSVAVTTLLVIAYNLARLREQITTIDRRFVELREVLTAFGAPSEVFVTPEGERAPKTVVDWVRKHLGEMPASQSHVVTESPWFTETEEREAYENHDTRPQVQPWHRQ